MMHLLVSSFLAVLIASIVFVAGCSERPKETQKTMEHTIKGTVTAIGEQRKTVTLDHEDIPGLMQGMEMEFAVKEPKVLEGIAAGDAVEGRLQKGDELVITRLQKK